MASKETISTSVSCGLTNEEKVIHILKRFGIHFVENFEGKLNEYFNLATGRKSKNGRIVRWIATGLGAFKIPGETVASSINKIAASSIKLIDCYVSKQIAIAITNNPFYEDSLILRQVLVNAAVSIFISYESQFMNACKNVNPELNLEMISVDAVERFFNYYEKSNRPMVCASPSDVIIKGIINGESKKIVPVLSYKEKEVNNIYVADFFEKVGLVTLKSDGSPDNYFKKRGGSTECGFRRLLQFELEKIEDPKEKAKFFNVNYESCPNKPREEEYQYILKQKLLKEYSEVILAKIINDDPDLRMERIEEMITEVRDIVKNGNELRKKKIWFEVGDSVLLFIGRKDKRKIISDEIKSKSVVVYGLPGVGKSELALQFADTEYGEDDSVAWINSKTRHTATESFHELHNRLGCKKIDDNEKEEIALREIIENVYEVIDGDKILFIFDGPEKLEDIEMFLPTRRLSDKKNIQVLITSTNGEWRNPRGNWKLLHLENFNDDEALNFIVERLKLKEEQYSDASMLAKIFDNFPLGLLQAVCYIEKMKEILNYVNKDFTIKEYIESYKEKEKELLFDEDNEEFKKMNKYDKTTYTALKMCLDKILKHGDLAKKILDVMSYLASNHISPDLLSKIENDYKKLGKVIGLLNQYSIVKVEEDSLSIHVLIQRVNKLELKDNKKEEEILEIILRAMNGFIDNKNFERMLPHVVSVWNDGSNYDQLIQEFIANCNMAENNSIPYLHLICRGSDYKTLEKIFNKIKDDILGKVVNIRDNSISLRKPVHYVAVNGDPKLLELLIRKGAQTDKGKLCKYRARSKWTPLHLAAQFGNLEMVKALTEYINIDDQTIYKFTALNLAAKNGYSDIVSFLLSRGADVNIPDKRGFTPLHHAVKNNHFETVEILLVDGISQQELNIDAKTELGRTPLHIASQNGYVEIAKILLEHGASVIIGNNDGFTPLHYAAYYNHLDIVKVFKYFLNGNIKELLGCVTSDGKSPLDLATEKGNQEIVQELEQI